MSDRREADRKLSLLGYLEGMRHVQTLEATEMAFVIAAFGFLVGGLVTRGKEPLGCLAFWVLVGVASSISFLLIRHFRGRRNTHYWLREQHHRILAACPSNAVSPL